MALLALTGRLSARPASAVHTRLAPLRRVVFSTEFARIVILPIGRSSLPAGSCIGRSSSSGRRPPVREPGAGRVRSGTDGNILFRPFAGSIVCAIAREFVVSDGLAGTKCHGGSHTPVIAAYARPSMQRQFAADS